MPPLSRDVACRGGDGLMLSHTKSVTLVWHWSQSHTDMVPFVSAVLLTCRAWQNRSGIERRCRRNFLRLESHSTRPWLLVARQPPPPLQIPNALLNFPTCFLPWFLFLLPLFSLCALMCLGRLSLSLYPTFFPWVVYYMHTTTTNHPPPQLLCAEKDDHCEL